MSLAINNAARYSMMQLTGQNRFTRSLSGGYKMTNGSSYYLGMEWESIQESIVRESMETHSQWVRRRWWIKTQCHVWCFYSPFHISSALLISYLQVILVCTTYVLAQLVHLWFCLAVDKVRKPWMVLKDERLSSLLPQISVPGNLGDLPAHLQIFV